jgi:hypothetical protein
MGAAAAGPVRNVTLDGARSQAVLSMSAAVAVSAGVAGKVTHTYSYALAGFAVANPTPAELAALAANPNVLSITPDKKNRLATYTTPRFLGLAGPASASSRRRRQAGGVWGRVRPWPARRRAGVC